MAAGLAPAASLSGMEDKLAPQSTMPLLLATALVAFSSLAPQSWAVNFLPDGVAPETVSTEPGVVSLGAEAVICVAVKTGRHAPDKSDKIVAAHNRAYLFAKEKGLKLGRGALEISARYEEPDGSWIMDACRSLIALPSAAYPQAPDIEFYELPAGRAVHALHRGDHATIKETIDKAEAFIAAEGLRRRGPLVEFHFNHKSAEEVDQQISVVTIYAD